MGKVFLFFTILATVSCKYKYHPEGVKSYVHDSDEWVRDTTRFVDETTFPLDPLNALDEKLSSGQDVIRENQKWLAKIQMNDAQANFIYDMINVRHSLVFTPSINNLRGKDDFEYCWVILAYNSDIPKLYDELHELGKSLSSYILDQCVVAFLDLSYPSNMATFGHLFDDLPSLLVRRPDAARMHKVPDGKPGQIEFDNLETFGYVVGYKQLASKLLEELGEITHRVRLTTPTMERLMLPLEIHNILTKSGSRWKCLEGVKKHIKQSIARGSLTQYGLVSDVLRSLTYCPGCTANDNILYDMLLDCIKNVRMDENYEEPKEAPSGYQLNINSYRFQAKNKFAHWMNAHDIMCTNNACRDTSYKFSEPKMIDYSCPEKQCEKVTAPEDVIVDEATVDEDTNVSRDEL